MTSIRPRSAGFVDVGLVVTPASLAALAESCQGIGRRDWQDTMDRTMVGWRSRVAAQPDSRDGLMKSPPWPGSCGHRRSAGRSRRGDIGKKVAG